MTRKVRRYSAKPLTSTKRKGPSSLAHSSRAWNHHLTRASMRRGAKRFSVGFER
jgi:hypothetical protein